LRLRFYGALSGTKKNGRLYYSQEELDDWNQDRKWYIDLDAVYKNNAVPKELPSEDLLTKKWWSIRELAFYLQVKVSTIRGVIQRNKLQHGSSHYRGIPFVLLLRADRQMCLYCLREDVEKRINTQGRGANVSPYPWQSPTPEQLVLAKEERKLLLRYINDSKLLKSQHKLILAMRLSGCKLHEVGDYLGFSKQAAEQKYNRAVEILRTVYQNDQCRP
jgi:hypothetical protein